MPFWNVKKKVFMDLYPYLINCQHIISYLINYISVWQLLPEISTEPFSKSKSFITMIFHALLWSNDTFTKAFLKFDCVDTYT